jgi:hypothetical protein
MATTLGVDGVEPLYEQGPLANSRCLEIYRVRNIPTGLSGTGVDLCILEDGYLFHDSGLREILKPKHQE